MAPGEQVRSIYLDGPVRLRVLRDGQLADGETIDFSGFATWSGTSFAAATVSGEIARLARLDGISAHAAVALLGKPGDDPVSDVVRPFDLM
jgi:hypothetical protein